ncbi:MAG: phytanoyl-CoA dioxygenase family protein [Flavisolibacter sp.]|nr:phytanoyl-CoA dioxygenase family protein [Flavisolibacter sp.]
MAELAMHADILGKINSLLGKNVLLWGSQIIKQKPFRRHRFHRDIEFSVIDGVAVWLAVKNVNSDTFSVIPGSQLFRLSPQELSFLEGFNLNDEAAVLSSTKKINPDSELVSLNISDGQYIIFHGKLWHGTKNKTANPRYAINLRYTNPCFKVRIGKNGDLPNAEWHKSEPECLLVSGEDTFGINRLLNLDPIHYIKSWVKGLFFYLPINLIAKMKDKFKGM